MDERTNSCAGADMSVDLDGAGRGAVGEVGGGTAVVRGALCARVRDAVTDQSWCGRQGELGGLVLSGGLDVGGGGCIGARDGGVGSTGACGVVDLQRGP